jgi:hypothetical protein
MSTPTAPDSPHPRSPWSGAVIVYLLFGFGFGHVVPTVGQAPAAPVAPSTTVGADCSAAGELAGDRNYVS